MSSNRIIAKHCNCFVFCILSLVKYPPLILASQALGIVTFKDFFTMLQVKIGYLEF